MKINQKTRQIIEYVLNNPNISSSEIHKGMNVDVELLTIKRRLSSCVKNGFLVRVGIGRGTKYVISPTYKLIIPYNLDEYFLNDIDQREIEKYFNHTLLSKILSRARLFTEHEKEELVSLQKNYKQNISQLPLLIYKQELERLGIDLSWKSSQIEGNTYSLLETELLLKEHKEAKGKIKNEARMLLNHKSALDYIIDQPKYFKKMSVKKIEEIHRLLIKDLGIEANIRKRIVGITGTNYKPLDNEFQIKEALTEMCKLVNVKKDVFEKALLLLLLISYIQPFGDGNKRTARIICNAILLSNNFCPLSFRTVDSIDYKKAILLFYEQNNISAFKKIFIDQYKFAVNTYFI